MNPESSPVVDVLKDPILPFLVSVEQNGELGVWSLVGICLMDFESNRNQTSIRLLKLKCIGLRWNVLG